MYYEPYRVYRSLKPNQKPDVPSAGPSAAGSDSDVDIQLSENSEQPFASSAERKFEPPSHPGRAMQATPGKPFAWGAVDAAGKKSSTVADQLQKVMELTKNKGTMKGKPQVQPAGGVAFSTNTGVQKLMNAARLAQDVEHRFAFLRARGKANTESKSHAPNKPIIWPIYDDAPKADKHMHVPSAEDSSLPKEEVDELLANGQIWGITSFFNPEGYQNKIDNFRLFRKRTTFGQGLPLVVVELAFGTLPFQLKEKTDAEVLIQRRTDPQNVLWQKERMLNIALDYLPSNCTKVVWLDADTFFSNKQWVRETARKLEKHVVVQPFAWLVRLPPETLWMNPADIDASMRWEEGGLVPFRQLYFSAGFMVGSRGLHHMVYHLINDANDHELGHCGIAWAAQRWLLDKHKFYDKFITGGADNLMFQAMLGHFRPMMRTHLSPDLRHNVAFWANKFYRDVRGRVSYTDGLGLTLWHGHRKNRGYSKRYDVLLDNKYDPATDIAVDNNTGVWVWSSDKPELHSQMQEYFSSRVEEHVNWKEYMDDAYHAPSPATAEMTKEEKEELKAYTSRQKKLNKHFRSLWQEYRSGVSYGKEHKRSQDTVTGLTEVDI